MKKIYILIAVILCTISSTQAQYTNFAEAGTVTYDKILYIKNIMRKQFIERAEGNMKAQFQSMIPMLPENVTLKKKLTFKGNETLFQPVKTDLDMMTQQMLMMLDYESTILSNLSTKEYLRYNDLVGQKVIIQDSLKQITWKITDEYREIAGYNCRRANGITADSVYVVGYYSNEIPIDGGPESVRGLPGLILGLVVPSQHISYFASQVEISNNVVIDKKLFENTKTKRMTRQELAKMMSETFGAMLNKETVAYIIKLALL